MQKDCPKAANLLFLYKYLPDGETWPALTTYYLLLPDIPALRCLSPAKEGQWRGRWSRCRGSRAPRGTAPGRKHRDQSDHLSHVRSSP